MNDSQRQQDFVRQFEAALPGCLLRIVATALQTVESPGPLRGSGTAADRAAAREVLEGGRAGAVMRAWSHEIANVLRQSPAAADAPAEATTLAAALTLKDKQEIDEDIELARLVQDLESDCEATLRELRALYSGLQGLDAVDPDAPPLPPRRCAATLGHTLRSLALRPEARLLLLRVLVPAALKYLPELFAADLRRLKEAQVKPADWRVRLTMAGGGAATPSTGEDAGQRIQAVLSRLMSGSEALGNPDEAPAGPISDAWMDGVVQAVLQEARPSPGMRHLMERLTGAGQRLAREEPQVWHQSEHAWWALLDRLLGLCAVLDGQPGGAQDRFAERCNEIAAGLLQPSDVAPDSALCRSVLDQLTTAAQTFAAQAGNDGSTAPPAAASGLSKLVREQMSQQLRTSEAPGTLRRFLMGPWLRVLSTALDPQRGEPEQAQRYTEWVDRVLASIRNGTSATGLDALIEGGREGLQSIGLPEAQIATWMEDLQGRLEERRQAPEPAAQAPAWRHEDLPTVPIDLHPSAHGARARRDRVAWIKGLRVGDICRLYLEDAWYTVQLVVDPVAEGREDEVFVFQSRDPDARHALTKDALTLMRADGLATTVEPGGFIAKALDTLPATLEPRLSRRGRPR
jgi:hypothetical protein